MHSRIKSFDVVYMQVEFGEPDVFLHMRDIKLRCDRHHYPFYSRTERVTSRV